MEKFSEKNIQTPQTPISSEIDAEAFKLAFQMGSESKPKREAPTEEAMQEANTVFEHHDEKVDYEAIENLTDDLLDASEPHEANEVLTPAESMPTRTIRHPRKEATKSMRDSADDDIDLDL